MVPRLPWRLQPQFAETPDSRTMGGAHARGHHWLPVLALALAYYLAGWWGIEVASLPDSVLTLVWPASGIALAAVLHYGYRACGVIFLLSAAQGLPPIAASPDGPLGLTATGTLLIGLGGALEPAVAVFLIRRYLGNRVGAGPFLLGTLVAMPIGAAVGAMVLVGASALAQPALATDVAAAIRMWHGVGLADYIGMVVVAPPVWLWLAGRPRPIRPQRLAEAVAYITLAAIVLTVREPIQPYFLLFLVYVALALRLRLQWAAVAIAGVSLAILWLTAIERGPIRASDSYETFLATLTFVFALNVASYVIALLWRDIQRHRDHLEERVSTQTRELEVANARLEYLSRVDPLTGTWNRRHFDECIRTECARAARSGASLCLVALDLDHFKAINDTHGHEVGDEVLKVVTRRLAAELRAADVLARTGGEEFSVLLVDCDAAGGGTTAERLRAAVADAPVVAGQHALAVTLSAGVTSWCPARYAAKDPGQMISAIRHLADRRLYAAKRAGRNRVEAGPSPVTA